MTYLAADADLPLFREKKRLRAEISACLKSLSEEALTASSRAITESVLASAVYRQAGSVFLYISVGREPDTGLILQDALRAGKDVYVPRCGAPPLMQAVRYTGAECLRPGRMGIPEPAEAGNTQAYPELVIVPCVSVSEQGARLGHGGGYYDAFLRGKQLTTLCLCHSALMREDIPESSSDVRMDWVACSDGLICCERSNT